MTQTATIEHLSTLFEQELSRPDMSYIEALRERWQEPAIQAGFFPLAGTIKVIDLPRKFIIHPLEYWSLERVSLSELERFAVPQEVREKLNRANAAGMPVKWLLWAEQHITPPQVKYRQKTIYKVKYEYSRLVDPALIALLKGGEDTGIPYVVHCWLHT